MGKLKERILKEMLESEEDEIVRKFRKEPWFDEDEIRRLYKRIKREDSQNLKTTEDKDGN